MKKILSFLLAVMLVVSAVPMAYAADTDETQDYAEGTVVSYTAANIESWTVTVPAKLAPGGSGTVTLQGTWPSNKTINVTAQETVTLTNSISGADAKTLKVNFEGISEAGNDTTSQTFPESVSVDPIANALFGTWDGTFYYNVDTVAAPVLEGDGQTFYTLAPSTLSFRSTAPLDEFQEVQVNGVTVEPSKYTVTEGSTIVTLSIDYLKTLDESAYQITVVSDSGSPSAGFSVVEPDLNEKGFYYNQPYTIHSDETSTSFVFYSDGSMRIYMLFSPADLFENGASIFTGTYTNEGNHITMIMDGDSITGTVSVDGTEIDMGDGQVLLLYEEAVVADENYLYLYNDSLGGYTVVPLDNTKTSYSSIRTGIYNIPTVNIGALAFYGCSNLTSVIIPDSVTTISASAFQSCTNLTSIVIPDSVTSIGYNAFWNCTGLTSVIIPDSVIKLEKRAFEDCDNLTSVIIGSGVTNLGLLTFGDCSNLTNITFNGTVEQWNAISKDSTWNQHVPATEVRCSDGVVSLS